MSEVKLSEILLRNLDKEVTVYCYDYDKGEVEYLGNGVKLWSIIVTIYLLRKNIQTEKMIEKLENIIRLPKILIFFVKSLKKVLYIWLKDYDLHCKLIMRLYPELYNPKRLLKLYDIEVSE